MRKKLWIILFFFLIIPLTGLSQQAFEPVIGPTTANPSQLKFQLSDATKLFVQSLKQCKPGTYTYDLPGGMGLSTFTTTIEGAVDGNCITTTTYPMGQLGNLTFKCQFSQQQLQNLNAESFSKEQMSTLSNFSPFSPAVGVMTKNCRVETTGTLRQLQDLRQQQNQ